MMMGTCKYQPTDFAHQSVGLTDWMLSQHYCFPIFIFLFIRFTSKLPTLYYFSHSYIKTISSFQRWVQWVLVFATFICLKIFTLFINIFPIEKYIDTPLFKDAQSGAHRPILDHQDLWFSSSAVSLVTRSCVVLCKTHFHLQTIWWPDDYIKGCSADTVVFTHGAYFIINFILSLIMKYM